MLKRKLELPEIFAIFAKLIKQIGKILNI